MIIITTLLKDLSLKDITPLTLQADPKIKAIIAALDPELQAITADIKNAMILPRIDDLDGDALDLLAWHFHADLYDLTIPLSYATLKLKRQAVKNSLLLHMKKGTVGAIKEALRQLDIQAEFIPWWQSGDIPYTFRLDAIVAGDFYKTSGRDILMKSIVRAVNEAKSPRSFMAGIHIEINEDDDLPLYFGTVPLTEWDCALRPKYPDITDTYTDSFGVIPFIEQAAELRAHYSDLSADIPETFDTVRLIEADISLKPHHQDLHDTFTPNAGTVIFRECLQAVHVHYEDAVDFTSLTDRTCCFIEYDFTIGAVLVA